MELPKYNKSSKIGEKGLTILKEIVESQLDWIFRPNHLEHDFGIDAYFDVVTKIGQVTGKSIAIQAKSGMSYFKERNDVGWVFRGEIGHLNYYLNHDIPVLIILINEDDRLAYWAHIDPNKTESAGDSWKMTVPYSQILNTNTKAQLEKFISPIRDYVTQLEYFWKVNKTLENTGLLGLVVTKEEIEKLDYNNIASVFDRLQVNPNLLQSKMDRVDIWVYGYDDDSRELFEISEVKNWIFKFLNDVNGWTYFLSTFEGASFLKLALICHVDYVIIPGSEINVNGIVRKRFEFELRSGVPFLEKIISDLNQFCDKNYINDDINIQRFEKVVKYLEGDKV